MELSPTPNNQIFLNPKYITYPEDALAEIFKRQAVLQQKFIGIENAPQFPCDLSTRANQAYIKDLMYRFIEELSEAGDLLPIMLKLCGTNRAEEAMAYMIDFNEELADATHFLVDILLYTGITPKLLQEHFLEVGFNPQSPPILEAFFDFLRFLNHQEGVEVDRRKSYMIPYHGSSDTDLIKGGRYHNPTSLIIHSDFLWFTTKAMCMAGNLMKNRRWTVSDKATDYKEVQRKVVESTFFFFRYLEFANIHERELYLIYCSKNDINHERIKNKR